MNVRGQRRNHFGVNRWPAFPAVGRSRQRRTDLKQVLLDLLQNLPDLAVRADRAGKPQSRDQLVDRSVGLDSEGRFGDTNTAGESRFTAISAHRGNAHGYTSPIHQDFD